MVRCVDAFATSVPAYGHNAPSWTRTSQIHVVAVHTILSQGLHGGPLMVPYVDSSATAVPVPH